MIEIDFKEAFILDENKRDELQTPESSEETASAESNDLPQDEILEEPVTEDIEETTELEKELEEIRDMFQQELDNASQQEIIQELDDIGTEEEDDTAEEAEVRLCECCGENPCSEDFGEDYPYCNECRELMKKYPVRASGIIMTIVMIAVFLASAFACTDYAESFITVSDSALNYGSGKVMTGMTGYYSYVEASADENISMKAVKDLLDGYGKTGYVTDAAALIQRFFSDAQLKLPWNKKYAKALSDSESLTQTYYAIVKIIDPVMNGQDYDYEEVMAALDALYETTPTEEEGIEAYDPVFIEYYKYVVMSVNGADTLAQLEQLKKVDDVNDKNMEWAYLANYCAVAARAGEGDLVDELYKRLIKINKEDGNAYAAKATYYRYLETPDPDKMLEICEEAKENLPNGDVSYMTTMAIAYLLKDEGKLALDTMNTFMSQSAYTVQGCNLYALCAAYNGNEEIYDEMKSLLEDSGYELSELVVKYKKGKLTIQEVLADKGGSI